MIPQKLAGKCRDTFQVTIRVLSAEAEAKLHAQESEPVAAQPAPILYQHIDDRYGLSLRGQPAAFTEDDPGWYRVPIDIVEPASGNLAPRVGADFLGVGYVPATLFDRRRDCQNL